MEKTRAIELIRALSDAPGASGFEDEIVRILKPFAETVGMVEEDKLRNLYTTRFENVQGLPVVQLDAHLDEVAFIVQAIKPNGTLRFLSLGRWVEAGIIAHKVLVRNALGEYIPGIVTSTPPHLLDQTARETLPPLCDMSIDIGATSMEEAAHDFHIRIGEPVVPDVQFTYDGAHDLMIGKAFDCRLGCAAIVAAMEEVRDKALDVNVIGAWACQEEVGTRGAVVTANHIKPDVAIVFEGCPADDTVAMPYMVQTALKRGPMLRYIDARMITHPRFQRFALDLGEKLGISVQASVRSGGSTNGAPIHLSGCGIPCIVIGIPVRYIHTHYGIASYADFNGAVQLASVVLKSLNASTIEGF